MDAEPRRPWPAVFVAVVRPAASPLGSGGCSERYREGLALLK